MIGDEENNNEAQLPRAALLVFLGLVGPSLAFLLLSGLLGSFEIWTAPKILVKIAIGLLCVSMTICLTSAPMAQI